MITRLLAVPAALAASAAFAVVPAHAATPVQAANPTTIGATCANVGETGQTITRTRSYFDDSAGTWTISNYNDEPLPITRTITETKTKTWNVSAGVDFPILDVIHATFSTSYTDTQSYQVGDTVGPYNLAPGKTAVLRAGWVVSDFRGQHTICGSDHTWKANGGEFTATLPKGRHIAISTRDNDLSLEA